MCGISGFLDYNRHSSTDTLVAMSDSLQHRGPDGSGTFYQKHENFTIGLAHRRLSIIDLSDSGKQPMSFGALTLVFNGEIYNYKELKKELEQLGHSFQGHSDTEMVLHAYQQWGEKSLNRFIGMFALVIFDAEKKELFCARDRAGVKPFFYYEHRGLFLFASELKAFHKHPEFEKELNEVSVAAFMQHGNIPTPHTIFKHCRKLKPGHFLKLNIETKTCHESCFWNVYDAYNQPKLDLGFEEAKRETEKLLRSAFSYRMVSDVPVGVFLSGGYDSTALTALLQNNNSAKLRTFTIGVKDSKLDEAPFARQTAEYLGTEHTEFYCDERDALELIPSLPLIYDEPFGDQSAIPTLLVSRLAVKDVKVALSADGGDEVFAGYNRYSFLQKQGRFLNEIPSVLRKSAAGIMERIPANKIPYFSGMYNFDNRYEKFKNLLRDPSHENFMLSLSRQYSEAELNRLLPSVNDRLETLYTSKELLPEYYTALSYMMAIDYQTYLVDDILQKVDRASMTFGLEGREPFLDHRLIEFAARLPDNYKYHKGIKKYMLREIVHQYVPKHLMDRPKMGFAIPLENWLTQELKPLVLDYLSPANLRATGLFNEQAVAELVKKFYSGKRELTQKIWYLLSFQMWYRQWMC